MRKRGAPPPPCGDEPPASAPELVRAIYGLCVAARPAELKSAALRVLHDLPSPGALPSPPGTSNLPATLTFDLADLDAPPPSPGPCDESLDTVTKIDACLATVREERAVAFAEGDKAPPMDVAKDLRAAAVATRRLPGRTPAEARSRAVEQARVVLARYGLSLSMSCSARQGAVAGDIPEGASAEEQRDHVYGGIVVSAARSCRFDATQDRSGQALANAELWVQDSRYLTLLPMQRAALVARTAEYDFSGGQATGVTDNRPSTAAALVALPGNIAGALVSGVTANFTNRNAVTNDQTAQLNAQAGKLNAEAALIKAKAALQAAQPPPSQ
jgi:hypothetical protein